MKMTPKAVHGYMVDIACMGLFLPYVHLLTKYAYRPKSFVN
jgi:hypothetical protein